MKKLILIIFLFTISCSNNKVVNNHGFTALEIKMGKIKTSETNKNDILTNVGRPSTVSLFDKNIWFYIEREKVTQSFLKLGKPKIIKNNVLEVKFNDYGVVESKRFYQLDNMNDLKSVKKITEKSFDNQAYLGKLLKSVIQKTNSPKKSIKKK
mgnify:CR=1 FL=1|jgi:outer membrane protein assembly factor BamE (lipoprotein component of BamABCDE complex)|tara:strand:+ start:138 stop:596 length:459 start_codon:yes stop_codon:yes gene_type:complete